MADINWDNLDPAIAAWLRKQGGSAVGRTGGATSVIPAQPTAKPAPPSSVTISQAYKPDYNKLILGDPEYQAFQANSAKSIGDAGAARTAALRKLAIQYGGLAPGFQDQYGDIDQGTLDLAGKNQFSDTANLQRNYEQGIESCKRQLAARGALDSGDLGYGLDQAEQSKGQQSYDLANQFGAASGQAVGNFTSAVDAQRIAQINALSQARQNQFLNPANRPQDAQDAQLDQGLTGQFGSPIYRAGDGSLWTIGPDGNPVSWNLPGQNPTPPPSGTVVPPSGSGNPFTGGAPGGTTSGDPEHNAYINGQSDVDPFAISYQVQPDGSVRAVRGRNIAQ